MLRTCAVAGAELSSADCTSAADRRSIPTDTATPAPAAGSSRRLAAALSTDARAERPPEYPPLHLPDIGRAALAQATHVKQLGGAERGGSCRRVWVADDAVRSGLHSCSVGVAMLAVPLPRSAAAYRDNRVHS